jgi:hypothetical protein
MARHDEIVSKAHEIIRAAIALDEKHTREEREGNPFPRGSMQWSRYNARDEEKSFLFRLEVERAHGMRQGQVRS